MRLYRAEINSPPPFFAVLLVLWHPYCHSLDHVSLHLDCSANVQIGTSCELLTVRLLHLKTCLINHILELHQP